MSVTEAYDNERHSLAKCRGECRGRDLVGFCACSYARGHVADGGKLTCIPPEPCLPFSRLSLCSGRTRCRNVRGKYISSIFVGTNRNPVGRRKVNLGSVVLQGTVSAIPSLLRIACDVLPMAMWPTFGISRQGVQHSGTCGGSFNCAMTYGHSFLQKMILVMD